MRILFAAMAVLAATADVKAGPVREFIQGVRDNAQARRDARHARTACQPAAVATPAPATYAPATYATAGGYTFQQACPNGRCPVQR